MGRVLQGHAARRLLARARSGAQVRRTLHRSCTDGPALSRHRLRGHPGGRTPRAPPRPAAGEIGPPRLPWPGKPIRIAAQHRLEPFYADLGFRPASAPYEEDGIAHLDMLA